MKVFTKFIHFILLFSLFGVISLFALLSQMVEREAALLIRPALTAQESRIAQQLLLKLKKTVIEQQQDTWLTARELNALSQVASHTLVGVNAKATFEDQALVAQLSLPLLRTPFYLNIKSKLKSLEASRGVYIESVQIGKVNMPGQWILPVAQWLLSSVLALDKPEFLEQLLLSSQLQGNKLRLSANTLKRLNFSQPQLFAASSVMSFHVDLAKLQQVQLTLNQITSGLPTRGNISLAIISQRLMKEIVPKVEADSEVEWGRAYLWGLAINFGSASFRKLIGAHTLDTSASKIAGRVTLQRRRDLALHFLYSGILEQLGGAATSFAIGELKELSDSVRDGSGFSFADLAADRAGIFFSRYLTHPDTVWKAMLRLSSMQSEVSYFPHIASLREGIRDAEFVELYRNTRSEAYRRQVKRIDAEIWSLPLYQNVVMH